MANAPIQIVLSAENFVQTRTPRTPGGGAKDFYGGKDEEFVEHRNRVSSQIAGVARALSDSKFGGVGYAKVQIQRSALAKSHRPTHSIFTPARAPVVGTEDLGSLLVEVNPETLNQIASAVQQAEDKSERSIDEKTKKIVYKPSRRRSEVGAVEQFQLWGPGDKRSFSVAHAVQWLSNRSTGGTYRVELFRQPPPPEQWDNLPVRLRKLFTSFVDGLRNIGTGLTFVPLSSETGRPTFAARLAIGDEAAVIIFNRTTSASEKPRRFDARESRHEALLYFLDAHPLVRSVHLGARIARSRSADLNTAESMAAVPTRGQGRYPLIGVIDGGISDYLRDWVTHRYGYLADEDRDELHGTFISGLLVAGKGLNELGVVREPDGCDLIDVDILPVESSFGDYYDLGVPDFFVELENAVETLRKKFDLRVFNMSVNVVIAAALNRYSAEASQLDRIALKHDVIFVVSAGNLAHPNFRAEWTDDATAVLSDLARSRDDLIFVPAESIRNVSVSAVNPPAHLGCIEFAPAAYSRRGPGLHAGVKPDLAGVGGSATSHATCGSGLRSFSPTGVVRYDQGTSYAAPMVAKTLATLDLLIEGDVPRETLLALLLHGATIPAPLTAKSFGRVARDLVGFGMPATAEEILLRSDNEITLVFASRLFDGKELVFDFTWPKSLVDADTGACRGEARLTLVSTPPVDYRQGAELVRVNIEAALQQEKDGKFRGGILHHAYLPEYDSQSTEADLIEHGLKWSTSKIYRRNMPIGVGNSSNWRLRATYLTRDNEFMPEEGVPFTVILTISDPTSTEKIFNEVRLSLGQLGVQLADIQTAARIIPRA